MLFCCLDPRGPDPPPPNNNKGGGGGGSLKGGGVLFKGGGCLKERRTGGAWAYCLVIGMGTCGDMRT